MWSTVRFHTSNLIAVSLYCPQVSLWLSRAAALTAMPLAMAGRMRMPASMTRLARQPLPWRALSTATPAPETATASAATTKRFARSTIRDARQLEDGARVAVGGWVKSVRKHKSVSFVNVNDGSCLAEMQVTLPAESDSSSAASNINVADITVGSSVFVEGVLREVPGGKQKRLELHPDTLDLLGKCDAQVYPLQKKYHSLEFLRENLHLRARTNTFGAVTRVRNALRCVCCCCCCMMSATVSIVSCQSQTSASQLTKDAACCGTADAPITAKDCTRTSKRTTFSSSTALS